MRTAKLTTCNNSVEAHLLQHLLEQEGIDSALHNENMTNLFGGLLTAFTGVDVFVFEDQMEAAQEVLKQFQSQQQQ